MPLKLKRDVRMHGVYYTHMAKHNRSTQKRPCCSIPIMRHSRKTETQAFYRSVALEVSAGTGIEHRWFEDNENILCDTTRCTSSLHMGRNLKGTPQNRTNTV